MKKLVAILAVICLSLTAVAAFAEEDGFSVYTDREPKAMPYVNTWVAENGAWRSEVFDEDGGIKLMITHELSENERDIWEYAAALNQEGTALTAVPTGLHYRQNNTTGDWDETYYEDGDANFTLTADGKFQWEDLKENAGKGLEFTKIGNFYGGRWVKSDAEAWFESWHDGEYSIRVTQRDAEGKILKTAYLKGAYNADTNSITAEGSYESESPFTVTFSYDASNNVVWTENGQSTVLEYSMFTD